MGSKESAISILGIPAQSDPIVNAQAIVADSAPTLQIFDTEAAALSTGDEATSGGTFTREQVVLVVVGCIASFALGALVVMASTYAVRRAGYTRAGTSEGSKPARSKPAKSRFSLRKVSSPAPSSDVASSSSASWADPDHRYE
jgi:hypothetical protein